ncbi:hypothetical protein [Peribacillus glennii]|uniref:Uncharacterized protein n=1 Tax=Peribacillus glennii TaxID=2303991 RepID=A0A372LD18_9BACI|nr:hypothetical protein [Peribacillus glennii]RFU63864.1 hypothetical protein D0466_10415 [Peribacillus glennii]
MLNETGELGDTRKVNSHSKKNTPGRRRTPPFEEHEVVPNLLNREFKQEVIFTDITYLFLY